MLLTGSTTPTGIAYENEADVLNFFLVRMPDVPVLVDDYIDLHIPTITPWKRQQKCYPARHVAAHTPTECWAVLVY
jgi:hypothetical protein